MLTRKVRIDDGSKPGSSDARLLTDRIISPAPTSSTTAIATSPTTSAARTRSERRPSLPRAVSLSAVITSTERACSPGASPTRMADAIETTTVNAATSTFNPGATKLGSVTGLSVASQATARRASTRPAAVPVSVSTQLSVTNWRTRRALPAPRAVRTAISRRRASDRATSRLATLAHAMSRTKTTAAISIISAGRSAPNSSTSSGETSTPRFSFESGNSRSS